MVCLLLSKPDVLENSNSPHCTSRCWTRLRTSLDGQDSSTGPLASDPQYQDQIKASVLHIQVASLHRYMGPCQAISCIRREKRFDLIPCLLYHDISSAMSPGVLRC